MTLLLFAQGGQAAILFEGYYRLFIKETPIGYFVQRYEYDGKKNIFISKSYLRTGDSHNSLMESLEATASKTFAPIEYKYTSASSKGSKIITATFTTTKNGDKEKTVMKKATAIGAEAPTTETVELPDGTFLSTFLTHMMLTQQKSGVAPGTSYEYLALAEEDGQVHKGKSTVEKEMDYKGHKVFKIVNEFKGSQYINLLNFKGETILNETPLVGIRAELMPLYQEATKGFPVAHDSLKLIFGKVPLGQENVLYKRRPAGKDKGS